MGKKFTWLALLLCFTAKAQEAFDEFVLLFNDNQSAAEQLALVNQYQAKITGWDAQSQGRFWHRKGLILEANQDIIQASQAFEQANALFEQHGEVTPHWVQSLIDLSYMKYLLSNDPQVYCVEREQAVSLARQLQDQEVLAGSLAQLAYCYQDGFDNFGKGLGLLQEAMNLAQEGQLSAGFVASINNATGNLYRNNQIHAKAYEYYQSAYTHWAELGDTSDMFNMQHNMVGQSVELGKWDQANGHVKRLYEMARDTNAKSDFLFFAHYNAGRVAYAENDFSTAVQAFTQAEAISDSTAEKYFVDVVRAERILAEFRAGNLDVAREMADAYMQQPNRSKTFLATNEKIAMMDLYFKDRHDEAMQKFWDALDRQSKSQQGFMKNAVAAQSVLFDQALKEMEEQALALKSEQQRSQAEIDRLSTFVTVLGIALLVASSVFLLWSRRRYKQSAETDFLTGAASRRHVMRLGERLAAKVRLNEPLSILMLDIDDFKAINDEYGHAVGDEVLIQMVKTIHSYCNHTLGRLGGEEFLLVLPATESEVALAFAQKLCVEVASRPVVVDAAELSFTVSIGVSDSARRPSFQSMLHAADLALYQAKSAGKNRAMAAPAN